MKFKRLEHLGKKEIIYISALVIIISFITSGLVAYNKYQDEQPSQIIEQQDEAEIAEYVAELLDKAKTKYYDGNYEASISYYQRALELEEDNLEAGSNLATIYEERGRYSQAIEVYQQLLTEHDDPKLRLDLAIAYYNTGQHDQASEEFLALSEQDFADQYINSLANYYLALIEYKGEDYQTARSYIGQALDYNNNFAIGHRLAGDIEFSSDNYGEAVDNYRQALRVDGSLVNVKRNLGYAYLELANYENAVKYLKEAAGENSSLVAVKDQLEELEADYPEYFVEEDRLLPEDMEQTIPEQVSFRDITPLEREGQQIRVGIKNEKEEIYFRVGAPFKVVYKADGAVLGRGERGELAKVTFKDGRYELTIGDQSIEFSREIEVIPDQYAPILLHNVIYGAGYYWGGIQDRQYRGTMEFMPRDNGITAVNLVGLEEYLLAVVPSEMSASWELEALRVQSVAARSYTLANLNRYRSRGYDLCDTVMSAAYSGITREHPRTTQAVNETSGEIMTYNGRPINAVYSANSGGHTENSEDVWGHETPYLKGVSTSSGAIEGEKLFPLAPAELKDWLRQNPDSYSNQPRYSRASNYRWQREVSLEFLENRLGIQDIEDVIVTSRGAAGSVKSLLVVGAEDSREFSSNLRYRFGGLRSNRFFIKPVYDDDQLVAYSFYGSGWGHSVGMDQVAVLGMVDDGRNYQEILKHFYTDIELEKTED